MENEDVIREQMEETRTSLTDKLEKLEQKVVTTVEDTTSAVTDTVMAVKETVEDTTSAVTDTVAQVKDSVAETVSTVSDTVKGGLTTVRDFFSIRKNPWVGMGGSILAGFLAGKLLFPPRRDPIQGLASVGGHAVTSSPPSAAAAASTTQSSMRPHGSSKNGGSHSRERNQSSTPSRGWLEGLVGQLAPDLSKFKGMALGMLLDASRDFVMQAVPAQWKEHALGLFHGIAEKLHATPETSHETEQSHPSSHEEEMQETRPDMERSGHRHGRRGRFDR